MFQKLAVSLLAVLATSFLSTVAAQDEAPPESAGEVAPTESPPPAAEPATDTIALKQEAAPAPASAPASDATELDDIVVTARKREESLQDIPVAVTPFNSREIERRGYSGLEDIARATPGFTFEPFMTGGAHANAVIRGLAQTFTTARIQNVSFFLDGIYLQRQSMLDLGMVDMERIEVVKGPQNALYGRNAFAGAVNYITLEPGSSPEGYVSTVFGDADRREYRLGITGPLNETGTVLGKITAGIGTYDGHTVNDHPVANADPAGDNLQGKLGGHDNMTYAASLMYAPYDGLKVRGGLYHSDLVHETGPGYSVSGVHAARFGLRLDNQNDLNCLEGTVNDIGNPSPTAAHTGFSAYCGEFKPYASDIAPRRVSGIVVDPRAIGSTAKTDVMTFTTDYDLTESLSVHYLYGKTDHQSYTDGGASDEDPIAGRGILVDATKDNQDPTAYVYVNTASGRPNSVLDAVSHELRFDWEVTDSLRTGVGLYRSTVKDQEWTTLFINDLCNADTPQNVRNCNTPLAAPNTVKDHIVLTAAPAYDQVTRQHGGQLRGEWTGYQDTVTAFFGSIGYAFTDTLDAALEGRLTTEKKMVDRYTDAFMLKPGESITYSPLEYPVLPVGNTLESSIVVPHDEATFKDFTPRGIVNWEFLPEHRVYLSAAKGVKTGGFNNSSTASEQKYAEETNWTYELGSKNQFFDRMLTLNAAFYRIKWTGLQGGLPPADASLSSSDVVTNLGGASNEGVELESVLRLGPAFSIDAGLSLNNPTYDEGVKYGAARPNPDNPASQKIFCDGVICAADGEVGGNQLARTSRKQYAVGLNAVAYAFEWVVTGRLDTNYQSKQYVEPLNLSWVPDRRITNASVNFTSPDNHWDLNLWGKNLTDEDYAANAFYIGVFDQYMVGKGPGRTLGLGAKYKF